MLLSLVEEEDVWWTAPVVKCAEGRLCSRKSTLLSAKKTSDQ